MCIRDRLRDWGMNVIRLGIIWDGLEPEPGVYDDAYLAAMDQRVAWAANHGLYVFLDMHQDLYSVLYSDGAPEWATLTDDQPHIDRGDVWSDAYLTSPAIQRAFENFWANAPASDGLGIQDHYAAAWRHVAERYADCLLYTSDAADDPLCVDLGGRRLIQNKTTKLNTDQLCAQLT